jgi:hypothetical protein
VVDFTTLSTPATGDIDFYLHRSSIPHSVTRKIQIREQLYVDSVIANQAECLTFRSEVLFYKQANEVTSVSHNVYKEQRHAQNCEILTSNVTSFTVPR